MPPTYVLNWRISFKQSFILWFFLDRIPIERIKIFVWFEEKLLPETLLSTVKVSLESQYEHFKRLLCKFFEYDPRNRPDAIDLWGYLNEDVVSAEEMCKST